MIAEKQFQIIPAIDIKGGRCVRLWQGEMDKETVYSDRPEDMVGRWERLGASIIHVVDLDGAVTGKMVNRETVRKIVDSASVPIELGGGIRDRRAMEEYHGLGVSRIILGTAAGREPERLRELILGFQGEVYIGIDARDGMVAVEGWQETLPLSARDVALAAGEAGAMGIIYTDIRRDGTMIGPNIGALDDLLREIDLPIIASGGVSSIEDIVRLAEMSPRGPCGVVVGRALYDGRIDLKKAFEAVEAKARKGRLG